jgi:hypothetical protein
MFKKMWFAVALMGAAVGAAGCPSGGEGDDDPIEDRCNMDGVCNGDETKTTCPDDCDPCGNGTCDAGETAQTCAVDCAQLCDNDGVCDPTESQQSCPSDCKSSVCGDNVCNGTETAGSCATDCTGKLRTTNSSSYTIYYLYFRACSSSTWSANQLAGTYITPGQSLTLTGIPFGCWAFRAEDSGHVHYWEKNPGVNFANNEPYQWTLVN